MNTCGLCGCEIVRLDPATVDDQRWVDLTVDRYCGASAVDRMRYHAPAPLPDLTDPAAVASWLA